jgi:hypothetical protein
MLNWLVNSDEIAADIYNKVTLNGTDKWASEAAAMCYSGAGDPFLNLLNTRRDLDVKSLVLVGTPLNQQRSIENTNLETVVTIYGEKDQVFSLINNKLRNFDTTTGKLFNNIPNHAKEIVIELKGIGHEDYFYSSSLFSLDPNDNIKKKASEFIARATARSKDSVDLIYFLNRPGITQENGKYIVDVKEIKYD